MLLAYILHTFCFEMLIFRNYTIHNYYLWPWSTSPVRYWYYWICTILRRGGINVEWV